MEKYWKCRDQKIEYGKKVLLMGILNVTPDSFSDGGVYLSVDNAVEHALELERDGADIIDIGAQSTRPGHTPVSDKEEWQRLVPVLAVLADRLSIPISVDTYYPYVAQKALACGIHIINDVSGVVSEEMAEIVAKEQCGWVIMHSGSGSPEEVKAFFDCSADRCDKLGIDKNQLCFDMGIGFGKNYDENMALLANVSAYKPADFPLLLGTSRKRVIGQGSCQENPVERTYGNIAADTTAILGGVDIIRLHDIRNEKQGILMAENLKGYVKL